MFTDGQVWLQISTAYAGVTAGDNSLHFNVSIYNNTRGFLYFISLNVTESNFLGTSVSLSHELFLQPGSYRFSATAGNRYGSSRESELTSAVSVGEGEERIPLLYWLLQYRLSITATNPVPIIIGSSISIVILLLALGLLVTGICYYVWRRPRGTKIKECEINNHSNACLHRQ